MKVKIVPAGELDPAKGLAAKHYVDPVYDDNKPVYATFRVADNVLEEKDFSLFRCKFLQGRVVAQREIQPGVYGAGFGLGTALPRIEHWLKYDPTGQHPEVYHQVLDPRDNAWRDRVSLDELEELLGWLQLHKGRKL